MLLQLTCAPSPPAPPPNIILITIDTLRADHLGIYGHARATSPNLDHLARQGAWFEHCYSSSAATNPSHAALFTGRHPRSTGNLANQHRFPQLPSLMDVLRDAGFATAGFISSVVTRRLDAGGEFDHFDDQLWRAELNRPSHLERPAEDTLEAASRWISSRDRGTAWFVWIHLIDPHGPYDAPVGPERFVDDTHATDRRRFPVGTSNWGEHQIPAYQALTGSGPVAAYVARYDAEIAYTDSALGHFFDRLRRDDRYRSAIVLVTADHGETLADEGRRRLFSHSLVTYDEVVRVPLIIKEAGSADTLTSLPTGRRLRLIDLMPTLLARLGLPVPDGVQGTNLLTATTEPQAIFSFGEHGSETLEHQVGTQLTVLKGDWRYIANTADGSEELYNRRLDPGEVCNRAAEELAVLAELRRALQEFYRETPAAPSQEADLTPEARRQLEALGYTS